MENNSVVRKHIIFFGYVQGVGFRYRARHAADHYGCTGWVRNRVAEKCGGVIIGFESTPEGRLARELLDKYEHKGETGEEVDAVRRRAEEGMQGIAVFEMP